MPTAESRVKSITMALVLGLALAGCNAHRGGGGPEAPRLTLRLGTPPAGPPTRLAALRRPTPRALDGLGPGAVRALLGRPGLRRHDGPARVWQYRTPACVIHVFLYDSPRGPRVRHVSTRARSIRRLTPAACLDRVRGNGPAPDTAPADARPAGPAGRA